MSETMKIYTKTGDDGTTSLYNMQRMAKNTPHFAALGDIDELNSTLGVVRAFWEDRDCGLDAKLIHIQSRLLDLGSHIATPLTTSSESQVARAQFDAEEVTILEQWIDAMEQELPKITNFILPSGGRAASFFHVARTQARRAERQMLGLLEANDISSAAFHYINRLSDFLFVAARFIAFHHQEKVALYSKHKGLFDISPNNSAQKPSKREASQKSKLLELYVGLLSVIVAYLLHQHLS